MLSRHEGRPHFILFRHNRLVHAPCWYQNINFLWVHNARVVEQAWTALGYSPLHREYDPCRTAGKESRNGAAISDLLFLWGID